METPDQLLDRLLAAKAARRESLAALDYAGKVRIVLRLQRMTASIYALRGKVVRIWDIDEQTLRPRSDASLNRR